MGFPVGVGVGRSAPDRSQSGWLVGWSGVPEGRRSYGLASRFKNVRRNRSSWIARGFTEGRGSESVPWSRVRSDLLGRRVQRWTKSGGRNRLKSNILTSEAESD